MSQDPSILVIGDVFKDCALEGGFDEFGGPDDATQDDLRHSVYCTNEEVGGAARVAVSIAALGGLAQVVGLVGYDDHGRYLSDRLQRTDGVNSLLGIHGNESAVQLRRTVNEHTICDGGISLLEPGEPIAQILGLMETARQAAPINLVLLVDLDGVGVINPTVIEAAKGLCAQTNAQLIVAAKPRSLPLCRGARVVYLSARDTHQVCGLLVNPILGPQQDPDDAAVVMARHVQMVSQAEYVIIERGDSGVTVCGQGVTQHFRTTRYAHDTEAPRATFLAALAVACSRGQSIEQAVIWANLAAGLAAASPNVSYVYRYMLEAECYRVGLPLTKRMDLAELSQFVSRSKRQEKRVVFASGFFSPLHLGHFALLEEAKRQGDVLVVAYASDDVMRQSADAPEQIIPQTWRERQLAMLALVDAVVRYDEATPADVIRRIKPDVLVYGENSVSGEMPGADFVVTHGGRVHFVPLFTLGD